jgi:hypothetical protein
MSKLWTLNLAQGMHYKSTKNYNKYKNQQQQQQKRLKKNRSPNFRIWVTSTNQAIKDEKRFSQLSLW